MRLPTTKPEDCPFCPMFEDNNAGWIAITPLNPVVEGHKIFIPRQHVRDFSEDHITFGFLMEQVAKYSKGYDYNVITSKGTNATQSVAHLHVHLVPREKDDGLLLPWSNQVKEQL